MGYRYITIEREYGSGATQIGSRLSEETGIPCYGREIIEKVAKDKNVSAKHVEAYGEKATNSFLYSIYLMSRIHSGESNLASAEARVYLAEQKVIQEFAVHGPGIFIGHCATGALKEYRDVLRVFVHADRRSRIARAVTEYGIPETEAEQTLRYYDRRRSSYYKANNGADWKDFKEYDLVLNSATLGIQGCVDLLKGLLIN